VLRVDADHVDELTEDAVLGGRDVVKVLDVPGENATVDVGVLYQLGGRAGDAKDSVSEKR